MTPKQADALRREWHLLTKMGYARQWTQTQKAQRRLKIEQLLTAAGQTLPRQTR